MNSVEIIVGRNWTDDVRYLHGLRDVRPAGTRLDLVEIRDIIDIVVDGRNITSKVSEESIFGVIGSLIDSLVDLVEGRSRKVLVEFHCEPWELVVHPRDGHFEISLYSVGHRRQVIAHQLSIERDTFLDAVASAGRAMLDDLYCISTQFQSDSFVRDFDDKLRRLERADARIGRSDPADTLAPMGLHRASTSSATGLTLGYSIDGDFLPLREYGGEHPFDMHALLAPGKLEAEFEGNSVVLTEDYPFLGVLALLDRARDLLGEVETSDDDSFGCTSPLHHVQFDVHSHGAKWEIRVGSPGANGESLDVDMPAAECLDVLLTLAELLAEDLREMNYRLELNHRLKSLEREVRELRTWYEELSGANLYHEEAERYLEERAHIGPKPPGRPVPPSFPWHLRSAFKVFPRREWEFRAERIYLSNISEREGGLLVPTDGALQSLDWRSGEPNWTISGDNADKPTSYTLTRDWVLVSRRGGDIAGFDLRSGTPHFETHIDGDRGRLLLGASEFSSLDLLVVAERGGRIFGIDPEDGQVCWTFDPGHGRFAGALSTGPLVGALTREGFFFGLDPTDGSVLWKLRLGGLVQLEPLAHQGRLYANSRYVSVQSVAPYTGRMAWQVRMEGSLVGRPGFADNWLFLPVERRGRLLLGGIDLEAPDPQVNWTVPLDGGGKEPSPIVAVDIDGTPHGVVQTDRFETTCFSMTDGEKRWRVESPEGMWRHGGRTPLVALQDCVLGVRDALEFRRIETGELVHSLPQPFHAPEFLTATGQLTVVVGEANTPKDIEDRLVGIDLSHFLAEV